MPDSTWLVSRELTQAAGPWDVGLARDNDGEYFCRVILASNSIRFIFRRQIVLPSGRFDLCKLHRPLQEKARFTASFYAITYEYLRSLEDSPRTRDACLKYLQNMAAILLSRTA